MFQKFHTFGTIFSTSRPDKLSAQLTDIYGAFIYYNQQGALADPLLNFDLSFSK